MRTPRPTVSDSELSVLTVLASHNGWANRRIFAACSELNKAKLSEAARGYDSVIGILQHLVQVQHSFFELAHQRTPHRVEIEDVTALSSECARIDSAYVDYTRTLALDLPEAETKRFLVPWFGFEITLVEGVLQPLTHSHKHRADVSMLLPHLGVRGRRDGSHPVARRGARLGMIRDSAPVLELNHPGEGY